MTGVRRALCDCCGVELCGYGGSGLPCSVVTSSNCPSTLAVTFSSSALKFFADCNYGVGAVDCQETTEIPAIASTVVTVTQNAAQRCTYTGSASISGSWTSTPCTGSGTSQSYTTIAVELKGNSHLLTSAQLVDPCYGEGCSPYYCAGVCAQITVSTSGRAYYYFSACWFNQCIADCSTEVPCYSSYANRTPDQTRTRYADCPSTNPASACVTGNGWSSACSSSTSSRASTDHIFSVAIS
jgi:hypothetical protein